MDLPNLELKYEQEGSNNCCAICKKICKCYQNCICPWGKSTNNYYITRKGQCLCVGCANDFEKTKKMVRLVMDEDSL